MVLIIKYVNKVSKKIRNLILPYVGGCAHASFPQHIPIAMFPKFQIFPMSASSCKNNGLIIFLIHILTIYLLEMYRKF